MITLSVIPGIRDYDGYIYFREWSGGLLAGGFEPKAKPCFRDGTPRHFEFQLLQEDWDQFRKYLQALGELGPSLVSSDLFEADNLT